MDLIHIKNQWQRQGFCIIPNFIDSARINNLQLICDDILNQWWSLLSDSQKKSCFANMASLTEPEYFKRDRAPLIQLLELIAQPDILNILNFIAGEKVLFHNSQYFFNPIYRSWDGIWHRDTQFLAPDPQLEKQRMKESTAVHFRIAFLRDSCLEYVPASEQRWDTPEEYAIRKAENGKPQNYIEMPGKKRILLNPGDALLFHAWGIHRGTYDVNTPRRTLDLLYQWGKHCDYCPPTATCFKEPNLLNNLSPNTREFFGYFIQTYQQYWTFCKNP